MTSAACTRDGREIKVGEAMSDKTGIEWADATWNPVTGCTKLSPASPGCQNCYAATFAERWRGTPRHYFEHGFDVVLRPDKLELPMRWRRPRRIFVNSMADLFHDQVPDDYIAHVFAVMQSCAAHTFQVLTKRHGRMRNLLTDGGFWEAVTDLGQHVTAQRPSRAQYWPDHGRKHGFLPNVWLGVSVEDQHWANIRIPVLLDIPAAVHWISAEPLLSALLLCRCDGAQFEVKRYPFLVDSGCPLHGAKRLDWVVVGGESGPDSRPMHPDWARSLRDQCVATDTLFLFKQWGEYRPVPVVDDDGFALGRAFDHPIVGRASAAIRVHAPGKSTMRGAHMRLLEPGDRTRSTVMLDRDTIAVRLGKKRAGRELDGRTWDEYPPWVGS
ncbi:phage Gp37/Gp68 family protein [Mycolicibacter sp. MYC098]|uniref:Phage Gp37/Gp68 family protein n=3 Tax=Mycobacteriaceae TaxID=1762 RepID=A0ABU5XM04_9MYCO|nr:MULTISPECIES: phage Gp37/Gp68 family protein [unclassified Mycolicibacter]MEB3023024.1 phage Gp37/Gp68 family protein [Mycolicibacter sp. MYC098]MEB3033534.1 phage Gp37/Gp68 family protein [Mycolicibacter sp. MYC340]